MKSSKMNIIRESKQKDSKRTGSTYLKTTGDNFEEVPLLCETPRINDFLKEAEIIPPDYIYTKRDASRRMYHKLTGLFMNPIQKWKHRRRFPWKLCLQILILILGTCQMYSFGDQRARNLRQNADMILTMNRLFLKDWKPEGSIYPYMNTVYYVYSVPEFYSHVGFAVQQYSQLESLSAGPYSYDIQEGKLPMVSFCIYGYEGEIDPGKSTINIKHAPKEECMTISNASITQGNYSIEDFIHQSNMTLNFGTLINARVQFWLKTLFLKSINKREFPECYRLNNTILYDNANHDGQISISMKTVPTRVNCQVNLSISDQGEVGILPQQFTNCMIILSGIISILLCLRSIYRSCRLAQEAVWFFKYYHGKTIPISERMDFIDFWYLIILAGDFMVVSGSLLKLEADQNYTITTEYTSCSLLLGIGYLLILMGTLRYFRLFPTYNILLITLKKAMPNVLRFMMSVILLFAGYCFCGWMVLAPYHTKFFSLSSTAESLFADMNGDEVYGTFTMLNTELDSIWWFARFYLYSFFFLFLYLSASLLVSVIMDTFEMVKYMYVHGKTPTTVVEIFLATENYEPIPSSPNISRLYENKFRYLQKLLVWLKLSHQ